MLSLASFARDQQTRTNNGRWTVVSSPHPIPKLELLYKQARLINENGSSRIRAVRRLRQQ